MKTATQIIAEVDLLYRNTFSTDNKLVWLNEEQLELFDVLNIDSPPYAFTTVANENLYPFPAEFDMTKIKVVTFQINDVVEPDFQEIEFRRNDDKQSADYDVWWTIVSDCFYLYVPNTVPADRVVYIYTDSEPDEVTTANINDPVSLPTKYVEILKLGILKRIAMARKDVLMHNNYDGTYQQKIADVLWARKMKEPEFTSATDVLPTPGYGRYYGYYVSAVIGP